MTAAAVVAGQRNMSQEQRLVLTSQFVPWAARAGSQCEDLVSIYYERHMEEDLEELRQRWRIITAPQIIGSSTILSSPSAYT